MDKAASSGVNRRLPLRMPPDWEPPYPSFMSEFDDQTEAVSMAVVGCQYDAPDGETAQDFASGISLLMRDSGKADHVDLSRCEKDSTGRCQVAATAYWLRSEAPAAFFSGNDFKSFWARHSAEGLSYGVFRELFNVPMRRFETLHSGPEHLVGVAHARQGITDPIDRHAYWGSMRDRIPQSADDAFIPNGVVQVVEKGPNHVEVRPNQNLAVIRSGQDLSAAVGTERDEYFSDVEPALRAGMEFLRDEGEEVNCFDCRYMAFVDDDGKATDQTYGLAYFRSLEDLENWAEHHPSHLAIFNAFLEFAPRYGPDMRSRYWHEVSVLPAENQLAEYINCAAGTGLLGGIGQ